MYDAFAASVRETKELEAPAVADPTGKKRASIIGVVN